ncbi:MAG: bis(5'-nucleosyl)-tetraphosphatase (symmetrical) YqeK [Peptococcaceae bacterium]|nr:bis(5'-nucleosyl)-tetraphosphatase (symmetrical) YqeK [Peptococcaceae bacterium]
MKIAMIRNLAGRELDFEKFKHVIGVEAVVREVAPLYGIDVEAACLAAVAHDLAKPLPFSKQVSLARELGLIEFPEDITSPQVLHGRLAADIVKKQFGVVDGDVLNAISYHTTGRVGMSPLEMLIYTADCVEPERDYPGVEALRKLLFCDLLEVTVACMDRTMGFLEARGKPLHPLTLMARESLVPLTE